ncbi:MAG: ABC transporter ATP-binding protein [Pseudomonadota bacterium]|jgi:lipopolysaccharide transport system ATP-binding protein|uniref:ABC transporter ATP-binding protein n=1 Tax=Halomonadaceae TaxID=28256 RepID=UPI0010BEA435|nr:MULTISPECIES: ABC transporter ATP-binding protein [Halomonas]MCC4290632.1 ABC transporter ATP-binding protein [Halomonas axialensis]MEE3111604.1 ABC transporter ATP-binding protein [Pseudomonadota bacterium]TKJ09919.1 ABC transporter ATP-binding protein [Halomonas sp. 15WGF]|tara:strand:+ start:782 stop:2005 length:1224 start_codon:yes stop_codon:yes gene_type:complete
MIDIKGLNKTFKLFHRPADRLKEAITGRVRHDSYHALKDISFQVAPGEVLGVLGRNGAGKSTLLKLLTGVLMPDSGEIHIDGRITGLLELGTGFNPELTGLQNITSNGLMLGMSHDEIEQRRQEIIEFSELGNYIQEPLRTYSSGMTMRLAFSIAIHAEPRCFLVDEALSVGDGYFQQKCMKRIREFKENGGSILFVSHDLNAVKMLCDRALVLEDGSVVFDGDADMAVNHYNRIMARQAEEEEGRHLERQQGAYGSREVEVVAGRANGRESQSATLSSGEQLDIDLTLKAHQQVDDITLGIMVRDRFGQDIFGANSYQLGQRISLEEGSEQAVRLTLNADIAPGKYTITIGLHSREHHLDTCYWWYDSYLQFEIAGFKQHLFSGVCRLPLTLETQPSATPTATPTE